MKIIRRKKDALVLFLMMLFLLSPVFFLAAKYNYIDVWRLKMIKTEKNFLSGNRNTIKQALRLIKKTSPQDYRTVLKYVDRISERPCVTADWHLYREEYIAGLDLPGCYTKGTKTIYLKPDPSDSPIVVRKRAEEIARLANLSKGFWENF